ncbi:VOC family protein [Bacillus sp. NP157]|nr:VOC family protein [Bacillus sp. NP157]
MKIQPYLHFKDNCEEAFNFYAKALGGKIIMISRYKDMPPQPEGSAPPEGCESPTPADMVALADKIMHARLDVNGEILMGSDTPPSFAHPGMHGFSVALGFDTGAEAEKAFHALAEGAREIGMPIGETFWAERFGMLVDRYGVNWMFNGGEKKGP